MLVKDFIKWLETQDQEATVEVLHHSSGTSYYDQGGNVSTKEFTDSPYAHYEYTDFRGNQYVKDDAHYYNKRCLQLGTKDN